MQPAALRPKLHVFVCGNRRGADSPLGTGCAERGDGVYDSLKDEVARRGRVVDTWITRTHCLGVCPRRGATVAVYGEAIHAIYTEVEPGDVAPLLDASEAAHG